MTAWPIELQEPLAEVTARVWGALIYPWSLHVTSGYGMRVHPVTGEYTFHPGIDISLPLGTPVLAIWPGMVERLDFASSCRSANACSYVFNPQAFTVPCKL